MSSHFTDPENAAIAARVSESLAVTPATPATPNSLPGATVSNTATTAISATDDSSSSLDHACATSSAALSDEGVSVSSSIPPSSAILPNHGDQVNKRPRPPLPASKSSSLSLLTQALASARGIPPDQRQPEQNYTQTIDQHSRSNQIEHVSDHPQELTPLELRHVNAAHCPGGSLKPDTTLRRVDPTRATSSSSFFPSSTHSADATVATKAATRPITMPGITETFSATHDGLGPVVTSREKGISSARTEKEARIHTIKETELALDPALDTGYSRVDGAASLTNRSEPMINPRPEYRSWRSEKPAGPEKAWSIGTGDVIGHQDGQVEKSIAEVLAGMEPTRSRKASHSLRFFKEGLPVDKVKRKEPKPTSQREKTSPSKGQQEEGQQRVRTIDTKSPQAFTSPYQPAEVADARSSSHAEYISSRTPITETPPDQNTENDYFSLQEDGIGTEACRSPVQFEQSVSTSRPPERTHTASRDVKAVGISETHTPAELTCNATEIGDTVEDGEESSEEKISSAVFLPHQSLGESADEESCVIEKVEPQKAIARSSTANDFHPWLVKADEPETEGTCLPDVPLQKDKPKGRKESTLRGRDLTSKEGHDNAVENDVELKDKPCDTVAKASGPSSCYYEDMVHEHQLGPKEPLEAIELIPYKHQVGGHTTIWRFSKRAVCKQLNNRENEFYEKIERYHRDLLPFLPRSVKHSVFYLCYSIVVIRTS